MSSIETRFSFVLFAVAFLFISASLGGCAVVTDMRSSPTAYHLVEQERQSKVYGAQAIGTLWAPFPIGSGPTGVVLFDHPVTPKEFWHGPTMLNGPEQRRADFLFKLATDIAPIPQNDPPKADRAPVRWILGSEPFVIAIGTEIVPIRAAGSATLSETGIELGMTCALASDKYM